MSITRYLVFVLVVSAVSALLHGYLWWRFVHAPAWPGPWARFGGWVLLGLAVSIPLSFVAWQLLPKPVAAPFMFLGYIWMGVMFLAFTFALFGEPLRIGSALLGWMAPGAHTPERRTFLLRLLAGMSGAGAILLGLGGVVSALGPVRVEKRRIMLKRLAPSLAGFKVVQITDVHIGPTLGREFLEGVVARINGLEADVVAITGDLVDGTVEELGEAVRVLGDIRARHGVYFVTGNHEYYSGADAWIAFLRTLGIHVLRNERVTVERGGAALDIAGIDDWSAHQFGGDHGADLPRALAGRDPGRPLLLLAHQPKAFPEAASLGVCLQVSGHTHGGQIKPFHFLTRLDTPFVHGHYARGESQLYVSPGTGFWGPPMRVGVPAEITALELHPADA